MKVFILSDYYDNGQHYEDHIVGEDVIGVYSSYEKAKQAAMDFKPTSFNVADESQRIVTDVSEFKGSAARMVKEYVDEYHQYTHELFIKEMEVDN